MIRKNTIKLLLSLQKKKARDEARLYVIEGDKLVREYLSCQVPLKLLVAKPEFTGSLTPEQISLISESEPASYDELKRVSTLKTPHNAVAVVSYPGQETDPGMLLKGLCAALELVQDPGNLGTIIRSAAWFGIRNIICSSGCADRYNPKVIQATMGAILHVGVQYLDLKEFLVSALDSGIPVFGAVMDGDIVYDAELGTKGVILLGNESKGISDELMPYITRKITIPCFGGPAPGLDSLNVGMAATILFSEFARRGKTGPGVRNHSK